jgi:EAL domain-containing protein (putative c-di-GMP-specific phosphodiesterase class I)
MDTVNRHTNPAGLNDRSILLNEINLVRQGSFAGRHIHLVVVNLADTKDYDEVIRLFGYRFADDLISIRLADLSFITGRYTVSAVGFWSIGFVYYSQNEDEFKTAMARLAAVLAQPVICRGIAIPMPAGIGVCDLSKGQGSAEDLLQSAYLSGGFGAGWGTAKYDEDHRRAFTLMADARDALEQGYEFELLFAARISLRSWRCETSCASLRWRHPQLGLVAQAEFLPLLQRAGLAAELTHFTLNAAAAQAARWRQAGHRLAVAVAVPLEVIAENPDFADQIKKILNFHYADAAQLELAVSIPPGAAPEAGFAQLRALRNAGLALTIDELTATPGSLALLDALPANAARLAPALTRDIAENRRTQTLLRDVTGMVHEGGMLTVARGVESPKELEALRQAGCDAAEGPLFSRPVTEGNFIDWYSRQSAAAS